MIRVLLADDEALIRAEIRLVLETADDLEIVAEAADGSEAVELVRRYQIDVALILISGGSSNAEIARGLLMSEGTAKAHVSRILMKLDCTNRVQAAILAHDAGLLPPM
jgi:DNA-binding NarL/FixJ family response regulator